MRQGSWKIEARNWKFGGCLDGCTGDPWVAGADGGEVPAGGAGPGTANSGPASSASRAGNQSPALVLPSVPVDQLLDDHAVEFEECKRWSNSEAGQSARMTNPAGFANVRAHAEAHLRAMGTARQ